MAHNNLDNLPEKEVTNPMDSSMSDPPPSKIDGSWRLFIVVIAVAIIAVLAYPLFQTETTPADSPADNSSEISAVTGSEATAQADPNSAQAQFNVGNAYVKSGQWDKAVIAYQKAIELDPNYQTAYANLGVVYYQQGKFDLAVSQYQKALELNPDDIEVAYNLGALYLQQAVSAGDHPDEKKLQQAITQLEQINQQAPALAEPYFSLGVAYSILNEKEKAIHSFETFLKYDSGQDPRASQEAQRFLQNLRGE
jgi:tetratricopeptide (TPR) repeat protein